MTRPPAVICAVAFIDGQNLFAAARDAFGVRAPSFDVVALSHALAASQGWEVRGVQFYSGVPSANDKEPLHRACASQLREMRTQGARVTVRPLRRRRKRVRLDDGTTAEFTILEEKGIDVRIALDIVRAVIDGSVTPCSGSARIRTSWKWRSRRGPSLGRRGTGSRSPLSSRWARAPRTIAAWTAQTGCRSTGRRTRRACGAAAEVAGPPSGMARPLGSRRSGTWEPWGRASLTTTDRYPCAARRLSTGLSTR